jgi:hypothetical protein
MYSNIHGVLSLKLAVFARVQKTNLIVKTILESVTIDKEE